MQIILATYPINEQARVGIVGVNHRINHQFYQSIDNTEMKHKFTYASANEAFDSAVTALKKLLNEVGYREENGVFVK